MTTSSEDNIPIISPSPVADIRWDEDGQPTSTAFGDIYFSSASGIDETRHVFVKHNQLEERWQNLPAKSVFTIAETGFGSGLNFLVAWQIWLNTAPPDATLHFISVEKFPLRREDLRQALALWPTLQTLSQLLVNSYPPVDARGFHRLRFGQVQLTLIFDDALDGLEQLLPIEIAGPNIQHMDCGWGPFTCQAGRVDAWFLDGFSPAKNPQMWSSALFELMAKLSKEGTTFATFTSAGSVRRGLQEAGFEVRKTPGFGPKRDMTCGGYAGHRVDPAELARSDSPSNRYGLPRPSSSWHLCRRELPLPQSITVIGAGLAGCHSAYVLAQMGFKVTVIDRADVAAGASGNPQGIVYSKLSSSEGILGDFNIAALTFALRFYQQEGLFERCGNACGVLQVAENHQDARLQKSIANVFRQSPELIQWLDQDPASAVAGIDLQQGGLWLPQAGWMNPALLCQSLLQHSNIRVITHSQVDQLEYTNPHWRLIDANGELVDCAETVVIACADSARNFSQCEHLPTKRLRGQISYASATDATADLKTVLCGHSYIAPAREGRHVLGASFNLNLQTLDIRWEEHEDNLSQVKTLAPAFEPLTVSDLTDGRTSFRCTTPDYLPMIGPVPCLDAMLTRYHVYRKNSKATVDAPGEYWPGLFINLGHGSKGLTYTPICAQLLAAIITNQPLPLSRNLTQHIHSARFLLRDIARNRI